MFESVLSANRSTYWITGHIFLKKQHLGSQNLISWIENSKAKLHTPSPSTTTASTIMSFPETKAETPGATETQSVHSSMGNSSRRAGMESSVLRWKDVNFVAGKGKNEKHILRDVSGKVLWGHTLAIMGPSGAGSK